MEIETIRQNVRSGRYQVKLHAVQHALKEGFGEQQMVDAVLVGQIIEEYPDRQRDRPPTTNCPLFTVYCLLFTVH